MKLQPNKLFFYLFSRHESVVGLHKNVRANPQRTDKFVTLCTRTIAPNE